MRGFKDLQAAQLSTLAGTTTRWGLRLVNSVAAQRGLTLFTADAPQAFLRGLTFEQAARTKDEVQRTGKRMSPEEIEEVRMVGRAAIAVEPSPAKTHANLTRLSRDVALDFLSSPGSALEAGEGVSQTLH